MTSDVDPDERRWAAELLGVEPTATPTAARRAYFRNVRESEFVPPRSLDRALHVFDPRHGQADSEEEGRLEQERRLRADVEAFATDFFSLSPRARCERWDELLSQCRGSAPLTARLEALAAGLEVEPPSLPTHQPCRVELAAHLLQAFPLAPLAQAAVRQAFVRHLEAAPEETQTAWEQAARYLGAEWPALAALDRQLVEDTAGLRKRLKLRLKQQQRQRQAAAAPSGSSSGGSWWWVGAVVLVVSGLFRGANDSSKPSSPPPSQSFNYLAPQHRQDNKDLDALLKLSATRKPVQFFGQFPPIAELLDPAKYDVEIGEPRAIRVFRFTRRGSAGTIEQPLVFGESTLRLRGVTREQIEELHSRATRGNRQPTNGVVGPPTPKPSSNDRTRP